jgi:hypothetical protein
MVFELKQWNCSIKISVELSITLIGFIRHRLNKIKGTSFSFLVYWGIFLW